MSTKTLAIPEQPYCPPVGDQFGDPTLPYDPDVPELLNSKHFAEFVPPVVEQVMAANTHNQKDPETGVAALRGIKAIGCAACELHNNCAVETGLQKEAAKGAEYLTVVEKAEMIGTAPVWLKAARLNNSGIPSSRVLEIGQNREAAEQAIRSGELDKMLGNVTNTPVKRQIKKADLPELARIGSIPSDRTLRMDRITTTNQSGKQFTYDVVDASNVIPFKDTITEESRREYGILCAKLLDLMSEEDKNGQPAIFTPDYKAQKLLKGTNAPVYELRMTGKNRLYFTIEKSPDGEDGTTARITIFGAHGGDASTQRTFISSSLN